MKMKNKCSLKRILSIILAVIIVMSTSLETGPVTINAAPADGTSGKTYQYEDYGIIYTVKSEWESHQAVEITIQNTGETAVRNWAVLIETDGNVTGLWNAVSVSEDENQTTVKNSGHNSVIEPGQSVAFGYTLEGENLSFPENISLCSVTEKEQETIEAEFLVTGDWGEGFQGEIHVHNNSDKAVSGWRITFNGNFEISSLWNGELTPGEDGTYIVTHTPWQNEIPAGGEYVVGFTGTKAGEELEIENCTVYAVEEYGKKEETKPGSDVTENKPEETINWEDTTDTDGDGLPDVYEKYMFKSNPENADSDGDGLPDGYEAAELGTSPVLADSNEDGIMDCDSDEDGDGLTNMQEYRLGTSSLSKDTDYDGLDDREELEKYGTDPLNYDSDGDGISDGDEVKLGLDPLNPQTHGMPDSLYCIPQEIGTDSTVLKRVNETAGNPYEISLSFSASGMAENNIFVDGTSYKAVFDSDAAVGSPLFIGYNEDMSLETVRVTYHVDGEIRENELDLFGEDTTELHGIRRLNVFRFDEEINMLLPVETFHDEEKGLVYADMDKDGIFCLMDMEKWIYGLAEESGLLGAESAAYAMHEDNAAYAADRETAPRVPEEGIILESACGRDDEAMQDMERFLEEAEALFSRRNSQPDAKMKKAAPAVFSSEEEETEETVKNDCPVDLVYILQTEGNDDFVGSSWIIPWYGMWRLEEDYSSVRMCVLEERLDGTYTQAGKNQAYWYETSEAYTDYACHMPCKVTDETFYRSALDMVLGDNMDFRKDSVKLVMYIPAGVTNIGFYHFQDCLTEMEKQGICYSELHDSDSPYTIHTGKLRSLVEKTGGRFFFYREVYWEEKIPELYRERIGKFSTAEPQTVFKGIIATGYKTIILEQPLSSTGGWDSDNDGLTDWEEVNTDLLIWNSDGSITLPTLKYCVENYSEDSYVIAGLERFKSDVTQHGVPSNIYEEYFDNIMENTRILPIHSHPRKADTDGDGILDYYNGRFPSEYHFADPNPLKVDVWEIGLKNDFFSVDYEHKEGALENWADVNGGSVASYGGNQSWFGIYGTLGESEIFFNGEKTGNVVQKYGCGLIAAADTLFYMAAGKQIEIPGFKESSTFSFKNNDYDTYISFVTFLSDYFIMYDFDPIYGVPGTALPGSLDFGLVKLFKNSEIDFYWEPYGDKLNESEMLLEEIIRMIDADYPVIFSYHCEDEGLPLLIYENKEFIPSKEEPLSHYMIFTGGFIYSEDISEIIGSRAMLQIATWGKKYYIDYTQYSEKLSTATNILCIQ